MSSHQRFSAALVLIAAMVGLGACSKDPTGVESVAVPYIAPTTHPLSDCTQANAPGLHGDTLVEAVRPSAAPFAARSQMVECLKTQ